MHGVNLAASQGAKCYTELRTCVSQHNAHVLPEGLYVAGKGVRLLGAHGATRGQWGLGGSLAGLLGVLYIVALLGALCGVTLMKKTKPVGYR